MYLLQGEEVPQRNWWLPNGLITTHNFSIQMNYLEVFLKISYIIWEKSWGNNENQEAPIEISMKQQVTPATIGVQRIPNRNACDKN